MNFNEIRETADKYLMPTYAHFNVSLKSGKNATYIDSDGKKLIDFTAGIGVNSLGSCDDGWKNAVENQLSKLQHTSNLYYNETVAIAAKMLCERAGYDKVLFCNSGAEANECAIKLARKYSFDHYGEGRYNIITLKNSFHGRTMATITATGQEHYHEFFNPFLEGFRYASAGDNEELNSMLDGTVCAVILEIIQGEGGVIETPLSYIEYVKQQCDENDILLIFDEVQTGVGRTGKLFAYENINIKPDILTAAKGLGGGLPIGACLCSEQLKDVLTAGTHGTTFGGNPVVLAGAIEVLNRIDDAFLNEVNKKGEYIKEKLQTIDEISEVRGMGLMIGIDLKEKSATDIAKKAVQNGLLILTAKQSLRMLPPLTITYDEIDEGLEILKKIL
ncbi:MAG: aspartate aminotransferase family protein [Oscillospiraceae bacterium]